jgi:hypothetical protein
MTGKVNAGSGLKRIFLCHNARRTQTPKDSQFHERRVIFTGNTKTGIASLCGLMLNVIDGQGEKSLFYGRVRDINNDTRRTVVRGIWDSLINEKLLPDNPPQKTSFRQLFFKAAGNLARAEVRIMGICIVKTDVYSYCSDIMEP